MTELQGNPRGEQVYVIGSPESDVVKIGRTRQLARRLSTIQGMSPIPLQVLWSHPGGSELEGGLHRHFASQRVHGEWFRFAGDPVETVRDAVERQPWATRGSRGSMLRPEEKARWLAKVRAASEAYVKSRVQLDELIAEARSAGVPLSAIACHTPYSREWARRIADRVERDAAQREKMRRHLEEHRPGAWCQTCEGEPHEPIVGDDGWCTRCGIHADDHESEDAPP